MSTTPRPAGRPSLRHRMLASGLAAATLLVVPVVAAAAGRPDPVADVRIASGAAWLVSPSVGVLTLIDGASEQVAAALAAGTAGGDAESLSVVQSERTAYVVDQPAGTVTGIDTATLEPAAPVAFGVPGGGLDLIAGGDRLYVLDHARRTASAVEPGTLRVLAQAAVGVVPGPGQAVVDDDGRLWLIDAAAGGITVLDGSTGELTTSGAADPTSRLVLVDGRPLLVDVPGSRLAVPGDDANGSCLAIQAGDDVRAAAAGSDLFVAVRQSGSVLVARAGDAGCGAALPAGSPGDRYGDIVVSGRFAFVPNLTEGSVYVIDGGAPQRPVGRFPIGVPGNRLQLLAAEGVDGLVFYNDLDSERAGVLRLQGGVWLAGEGVRKFNPVDPSDGLFVPAVGNDDPAPEIAAAPDIVGAPPMIASEPPTSESRPTTPEPSTVSSTASAAPSTTTSTEPADTSAPVSTDDPAPAEPAVAPTTAPVSPPAATTAPAPTTTTPTTPPTADPTATAAPTTTPPTTATPPPATTAPITTTLTAPPPAGLRDVTETTVTAPALVPFKSTFTLSVEVSNAGGEIRPSGSVTVTRVGNGTSTVLGTFRLVSSRVEVNLSAPFLGTARFVVSCSGDNDHASSTGSATVRSFDPAIEIPCDRFACPGPTPTI